VKSVYHLRKMSNPTPPSWIPDYRRSGVALKYVKRGYTTICTHFLTILLIPIGASVTLELLNLYQSGNLVELLSVAKQTDLTINLVTLVACLVVLAAVLLSYVFLKNRPVYLVDFSVWVPPSDWYTPMERFISGSLNSKKFTEESMTFQEKILARSGLGTKTSLPPLLEIPDSINMENARKEFETVMFQTVADILKKTGVKPKDIGILVVNCSLFNPTPSLCAMVINHFKMRSNIISYNLSGMGCSASPIAIDLARQMLQIYPNQYALVLSNENITQNWYFGNDRSMLLPNCLFRVGGAAMLLSNKRRDYWRSKYELLHTVRTHLGASDAAYSCIFQCEDDEHNIGVRLTKELMAVAGEALKINVTTLGPMVLPISEQLIFFVNLILRKVLKVKTKAYIPDFNLAFDKVCIHTGGRAVIDEIERQLKLAPEMVEPSRAVLYRYGNTSSSSIWYVLAYLENFYGMKKGDKIWQLGFGSGFKCNTAVWKALHRGKSHHAAWDDFDVKEMRDHLATLINHTKKRA